MTAETARVCLSVIALDGFRSLDITGGAPEMNPSFRELVVAAREMSRRVIDRCNLTILLAPGYDDLPEFLAQHRSRSSLRCPAIWKRTPTDSEATAFSNARSRPCEG